MEVIILKNLIEELNKYDKYTKFDRSYEVYDEHRDYITISYSPLDREMTVEDFLFKLRGLSETKIVRFDNDENVKDIIGVDYVDICKLYDVMYSSKLEELSKTLMFKEK